MVLEGQVREADRAARLCPACGHRTTIQPLEAMWPTDRSCTTCGHRIATIDGIPLFDPDLADTVAGFDPASFASLAGMERGHFWFEPRNRLLVALLKRHFPDAGAIMEIGCGTGFVLEAVSRAYPAARLVGSELHPSGLFYARERLGERAELVQMDARSIPAASTFDVVCAFDVLEHIKEDETVLAAMRTSIAPGGGVLLAVPQHPWLWSTTDDIACHVRRYRRGELEAKVEGAGFEIMFSASYTSWPLPLMVLSRAVQRLQQKGKPNPKASEFESRPGPAINAALRRLLDAEVTATLAGLHHPVGGSRIIAAKIANGSGR